jgi:Golgi phosphoprotein 3
VRCRGFILLSGSQSSHQHLRNLLIGRREPKLYAHVCSMASSASGLTRRRGGGGGAGSSSVDNADGESSRVASPTRKAGSNYESRAPETSYSSSENGHKIAFDPRDISESEERNKQPKLTLMEEVLLLGLKDKQVG